MLRREINPRLQIRSENFVYFCNYYEEFVASY